MKTQIAVALLLVPSLVCAQTPQWDVVVIPPMNPVPLGMCYAAQLSVTIAGGHDRARDRAGYLVDMSQFDMVVTGGGTAGYQFDAAHLDACGCQGGVPGGMGTITARYPARSLPEARRWPGLTIVRSATFTTAAPKGPSDPPSCLAARAAQNSAPASNNTASSANGAAGGGAPGAAAAGGANRAVGSSGDATSSTTAAGGAPGAAAGAAASSGNTDAGGAAPGAGAAGDNRYAGSSGSSTTGAAASGGSAPAAGGAPAGTASSSAAAGAPGAGAAGGPAAAAGGAPAAAGGAASSSAVAAPGALAGAGRATGATAPPVSVAVNPTGLTALQVGAGQVLLSWDPVREAQFYAVFGPGLTPGGQRVEQVTAALAAGQPTKVMVGAFNVPAGRQEWAVASFYANNLSTPPAAFPRVSLDMMGANTNSTAPGNASTTAPAGGVDAAGGVAAGREQPTGSEYCTGTWHGEIPGHHHRYPRLPGFGGRLALARRRG